MRVERLRGDPERHKREKHDATIIQFEGGHTTVVTLLIQEVAAEIGDAREGQHSFYFIQAPNLPRNGLAIDPHRVVALVRTTTRT
jgi:hypothetical protein